MLQTLDTRSSVARVASTKPVLVMYVTDFSARSSFSSAMVPSQEQFTVVANSLVELKGYTQLLLKYKTFIWTESS